MLTMDLQHINFQETDCIVNTVRRMLEVGTLFLLREGTEKSEKLSSNSNCPCNYFGVDF